MGAAQGCCEVEADRRFSSERWGVLVLAFSSFAWESVGDWVIRAFRGVGMVAWFLVVVLEVIYYSGCRSFPLSAIFLVLLPRVVGWPLCVLIWTAWPCQRLSSVCASS